ncbi:hypothetical protein [Chryseobacterium hispalense]|uniref:hypothetical protein n=1 Tax=Chryseobacterium hispalense TaxID=1453492 RepID=UPI0004938136|nr:hypothetical protein [Chryseobacterium hispalense]
MDIKIKNLIQLLKDKTANKNAIWSRTSGNNEFKIEINNATITTDCWFTDDILYYDFVILNENGEVVERISVSDTNIFSEEYQILSDFYDVVKNSYFKIDETIDNILNELNTNTKIGFSKKNNTNNDW